MAKKLKNLEVTKVDFVDEGANPDADIFITKKKDGDEEQSEKSPSVLKRIFSFIAKAAGIQEEEIDSAINDIQKSDAETFGEKLKSAESQKIADEIWEMCYAMQSSLCSILFDEDLDSTQSAIAMQKSLDEFTEALNQAIPKWSQGTKADVIVKNVEETDAGIESMKKFAEKLNERIEKATDSEAANVNPEEPNTQEGEDQEMIDKSKMTPEDLAVLEDLEKRYNAEGEVEKAKEPAEAQEPEATTEEVDKAKDAEAEDDVYKNIHPAVKAQLEELKKFKEQTEERELREVAKKYTVTGRKEEDLVQTFKSLKAAGGSAYDDMIAVLDQTVDMIGKAKLFEEIGKSGNGAASNGAWAEAEAKAVELMKSKSGLTKAQALDEVFQADSDLAKKCEEEE